MKMKTNVGLEDQIRRNRNEDEARRLRCSEEEEESSRAIILVGLPGRGYPFNSFPAIAASPNSRCCIGHQRDSIDFSDHVGLIEKRRAEEESRVG